MTSVLLQPAFLLHANAYRETSLLAKVFTRDFGLIHLVIKGARQPRSRYFGVSPFTPLLISYKGRTDLFQLTDVELVQMPYRLEGNRLFCGFYLNELLIRLLLPQESFPTLFLSYKKTLQKFACLNEAVEPQLRQFELSIIQAMGYRFELNKTKQGDSIQQDNYYIFDPKQGLIQTDVVSKNFLFKGEYLLNFWQDQWSDPQTHLCAKRLMQQALAPLIGDKPLRTRSFFKKLSNSR
jgi:DNA repair protein RecO (recombination protein O)